MNSTNTLLFLGAVLFIGYYYYRLVATTRFSVRRLWIMPLILAYFAVTTVPNDLLSDSHQLEAVVLSIGLGLVNGVFQGCFMTVVRGTDGMLYQKGSWTAALVLLLTMPLRFGLRYLVLGMPSIAVGGADPSLEFTYIAMFLAVVVGRAVTLLVRNPVLFEEIRV